MADHNLRFPPDSTGKRVGHTVYVDLDFSGGTIPFKMGDKVTCATSGLNGTVIKIKGTTATGAIYVRLDGESPEVAVLGENILVGATIYAVTANTGMPIYNQSVVIVGANNPKYGQDVDSRGQALMRFAEGSPSMDAFGNLRTSMANILGGYEYSTFDQAGLFTDNIATGGTITYDPVGSRTVLGVTGTNGSSAIRTTNRYHFYQPGVGNLVIMTQSLNDTGKANNIRRWGYFDQFNGLFFELNGTTLNVVKRSNTTGAVVDTPVPQSQWNGDHMDGTGVSGMTLDLTKANFYWIDYTWLGVGTVRFGVLAPDGARWVCHTIQNPNSNIGPYTATGSLPIRYENVNVGATSGTSEINAICAAIYAESNTSYVYWRYSDMERTVPVTVTTATPILSVRPKLEVVPGKPNRTGVYPELLNVFVSGGNCKITLIADATLSGATWGLIGVGATEGDIGATAYTGGTIFHTEYVGPGPTNIDLSKYYETNDEGLHVLADSTGAYTFTVAMTRLDGTTVTAVATLNYRELN